MFRVKAILLSLSAVALSGCLTAYIPPLVESKIPEVPSPNTPNPYGITGTVNARNVESLAASLQDMTKGLSQTDELEFMESFFRVAQFNRCDKVGRWRDLKHPIASFMKLSLKECIYNAHSAQYFDKLASAYVSDGRLDSNPAYTSTSLLFGTVRGGNTIGESYAEFISLYGDTIHGRDANYIVWRDNTIRRRTATSEWD